MSMYGKYKPGDVIRPGTNLWPATDFSGDKGFTVQADRDEADINKIVARFQKTGQLPPARGGQPFFGDVSDIDGLADAYMKIKEADDLFMQYPAEVRERFDNDPVKMIDFLSDEGNRKEAIDLGLVVRKPDEVHPNERPRPVDPVPVPPAPAAAASKPV